MPSIATTAIKYSLILPPTCQSFVFVLAAAVLAPQLRFADGDLFRFHSADDGAVTWLQDVAAKALAK